MVKLTTLLSLVIIGAVAAEMDAPKFVYHNHCQLTAFLKDVEQSYPNITHLYSIGKSIQGLCLLCVQSHRSSSAVAQG